MTSTARPLACAPVTLALVGVDAQSQAYTGQVMSQVTSQGTGTSHHHRRLEQDGSSRVLRALGRLDRRLVHATSAHRLAPLTDADRDALQDHAEADEAAVGAVATSYTGRPSVTRLAALRLLVAVGSEDEAVQASATALPAHDLAGEVADELATSAA